MIRGVVALPGGGKSYFCVRFLIDALVNSRRWIVTTSQELRLDKLQAYLDAKYPKLGIDVSQRVQIIPKTEATRWYRYRGFYTLPAFEYNDKSGETPEALDARMEAYYQICFEQQKQARDFGVCYFIDEAHRVFSAELYATFAKMARFYLTQHRHLDDMVWLSTQNPEQIVVTIRRLVQDTHILRNQAFESFFVWAKPKKFAWALYEKMPDSKEKGLTPMDEGKVTPDWAGIGECYYTRGALGGTSPLAETPPKRRKLPFWTLPAAGLVVVAAVVGMLRMLPEASTWLLKQVVGGAVEGVRSVEGGKGPAVVKQTSAPGVNKVTGPQAPQFHSPVIVGAGVYAKGYAIRGNTVRVYLSDGTELDESKIRQVGVVDVLLRDGTLIPFRRHVESPKSPSGGTMAPGAGRTADAGAGRAGAGLPARPPAPAPQAPGA